LAAAALLTKADKVVPVEDAHAIIRHCPKSHIELFIADDAGHESVDKFEEHSDKLLAFLRRKNI